MQDANERVLKTIKSMQGDIAQTRTDLGEMRSEQAARFASLDPRGRKPGLDIARAHGVVRFHGQR